ncbi:hypothetical protein GCM10022245_34050 [Streptomyces mayteni]
MTSVGNSRGGNRNAWLSGVTAVTSIQYTGSIPKRPNTVTVVQAATPERTRSGRRRLGRGPGPRPGGGGAPPWWLFRRLPVAVCVALIV